MSETNEKKEPTLEQRLAKAEAENAKLKGKVKDLNEELQVKEATAPKDALPTVKVEGKHYRFVSPKFYVKKSTELANGEKRTRMSSQVVTAVDAAKDPALCAELVKSGSGVLKHIETK